MSNIDKKKYFATMTKELHKPITRKFKRAQVITRGLDDIWACDLVDMQQFKDENDGYKYMLNCVDCFSRYAWSVPLKDKTGPSVLNAFKKIVAEGRSPSKLWVDQGKEFINRDFKKYLDQHKIIEYHTYGEHKASIVERFNRTLKSIMWRRFTENQNNEWVDMLPELIKEYNNTKHSSIKMTPIQASKAKNQAKLWEYQYGDVVDVSETAPTPKFTVGTKHEAD